MCKISSFGVSKRMDDINDQDVSPASEGTVFWMIPEIVDTGKRKYSPKEDIWSVGCVVLEMWSGERPWEVEETISDFVEVRPVFPSRGTPLKIGN
jgi:serine/threonine protein kinase